MARFKPEPTAEEMRFVLNSEKFNLWLSEYEVVPYSGLLGNFNSEFLQRLAGKWIANRIKRKLRKLAAYYTEKQALQSRIDQIRQNQATLQREYTEKLQTAQNPKQ